VRIIPFRGEYYMIRAERRSIVRGLIYPVPDPEFPFLGVHFTRTIHGDVEAGPNAVLAVAREGYSLGTVRPGEFLGTLGYAGFWHMARKYWRVGAYEMYRSASKAAFVRSLQKLVPDIRSDDLERGGAGVRAQAVAPDGSLVDDFKISVTPGAVHVVNAPSPARPPRSPSAGTSPVWLPRRSAWARPELLLQPILHLAEPVLRGQQHRGQLADQRQGERGIRAHKVIEPVRGDDHEGDRVRGDRGGGAGSVAEEGDVAEQLTLGQGPEETLLTADLLSDLHPAQVEHEGLALGVVSLAEDDRARLERPRRYLPDLAAHELLSSV